MSETHSWRRIALVLCVLVVVFVAAFNYWDERVSNAPSVDFQSCLQAGNPIMESYPRRCTSGGETFVEDLGTILEKDQLIRVIEPRPNSVVSSPLSVLGTARGTWFFEGSFPVILEAEDGTVLASGVATALSEWMTEDFVPFKTTFTFDAGAGGHAKLILKKDNPSGLPQNDDSLSFPVVVASGTEKIVGGVEGESGNADTCVVTGCSGQICAESEMMSTCEYRAEYACYKTAKCEKQSSGQCGWSQTSELSVCLAGGGEPI